MKTTSGGLLSLVIAFSLLSTCPAGEDQQAGKKKGDGKTDEASVWMTKKLELSKKILQGLTTGDFKMVEKNAGAMIAVNYLEEWDRSSMPAYRKQLKAFAGANKELVKQAKKKDVTAATKAYTQLVMSCVECHTVIRDAKKK